MDKKLTVPVGKGDAPWNSTRGYCSCTAPHWGLRR